MAGPVAQKKNQNPDNAQKNQSTSVRKLPKTATRNPLDPGKRVAARSGSGVNANADGIPRFLSLDVPPANNASLVHARRFSQVLHAGFDPNLRTTLGLVSSPAASKPLGGGGAGRLPPSEVHPTADLAFRIGSRCTRNRPRARRLQPRSERATLCGSSVHASRRGRSADRRPGGAGACRRPATTRSTTRVARRPRGRSVRRCRAAAATRRAGENGSRSWFPRGGPKRR